VNQITPRTVLGRDVAESLTDADIPVLSTMVHTRQVYRRVIALGSSVVTEPGPARDEVLALAGDITNALQSKA
jgi:hypothetical protein